MKSGDRYWPTVVHLFQDLTPLTKVLSLIHQEAIGTTLHLSKIGLVEDPVLAPMK
jgi:hypothetical protein